MEIDTTPLHPAAIRLALAMVTKDMRIDTASLPDITKEATDFRDTSFFRFQESLPTPAEVLGHHGDRFGHIVTYEELNLVVKFGHQDWVRLEEAQAMWAIKKAFPKEEIPVPELFGWRRHDQQVFIYMSLIPGKTLRQAWPLLTCEDKVTITTQLAQIVKTLRTAEQGSSKRWIGSVNGGVLQDRYFKLDYEKGPFYSVKEFNDWVFAAGTRQIPGPDGVEYGPYADFLKLPDAGDVYFAHGDLTLGNIIVSRASGNYKIVGIIDWEQAGWYPECWEYFKLLYAVEDTHEWRSQGWVDRVMRRFEHEFDVLAEYFQWRSP